MKQENRDIMLIIISGTFGALLSIVFSKFVDGIQRSLSPFKLNVFLINFGMFILSGIMVLLILQGMYLYFIKVIFRKG